MQGYPVSHPFILVRQPKGAIKHLGKKLIKAYLMQFGAEA